MNEPQAVGVQFMDVRDFESILVNIDEHEMGFREPLGILLKALRDKVSRSAIGFNVPISRAKFDLGMSDLRYRRCQVAATELDLDRCKRLFGKLLWFSNSGDFISLPIDQR